jgi:uroporphyrin-III C-methyltransferase / precorrin-2 dehydrogenase / sirohydrochlorin ferrochelatase
MRVFLASIPLEGRKVVVVGGGEPGAAKARLIARTPAELVWYAPDAVPPQAERPAGRSPLPRWPEPGELDGAILVFLAVFDAPETAALAAEARVRGALVNVVDRPGLCDFHTPALVDRGEVVIGIATGGSAPILARDLRARIEAVLPDGLEALAELAREIRDVVKAKIADPLERRRYWERAFRGRAADLAAAGEVEAAREELHRLMAADAPAKGGVWLVQAPAEADLLTLKALRILQNADLVVHDAGVSPAVIDCARRDARRIEAGPDSAPIQIAEAAARGSRVARLTTADPAPETAALKALGIEAYVTSRP